MKQKKNIFRIGIRKSMIMMNNFNFTNFDAMREWLKTLDGSPAIRRARIDIFDRFRYREDYEAIYQLIIDLGGVIS